MEGGYRRVTMRRPNTAAYKTRETLLYPYNNEWFLDVSDVGIVISDCRTLPECSIVILKQEHQLFIVRFTT